MYQFLAYSPSIAALARAIHRGVEATHPNGFGWQEGQR